ncbi:MAG TPA: hypothetical protein VGM84_20740 [Steroidobacteraceae bacterium]|jgi:hypothetical protein
MTGQFVLILLTLNANTGALVRSQQVGEPFESAEVCLRAATQMGPQSQSGDLIRIFTCRGVSQLDASI